jgi:hypothetical protein
MSQAVKNNSNRGERREEENQRRTISLLRCRSNFTSPLIADSNYEVDFEISGAYFRRDLLLVITGVVVGLAGNFLTSLLPVLFKASEQKK